MEPILIIAVVLLAIGFASLCVIVRDLSKRIQNIRAQQKIHLDSINFSAIEIDKVADSLQRLAVMLGYEGRTIHKQPAKTEWRKIPAKKTK